MDEAKTIKKEAEHLLGKLGVKTEVDVSKNEDLYNVNIAAEEGISGILIGYHGETLSSLQLILSLIVSKKLGQFARIILNIGDYRERREEKLKEIAIDAARRARETKQEVILTNLSPWQRRIVHMTLAEDKEVSTESQGEEPERQLVIRPKSM